MGAETPAPITKTISEGEAGKASAAQSPVVVMRPEYRPGLAERAREFAISGVSLAASLSLKGMSRALGRLVNGTVQTDGGPKVLESARETTTAAERLADAQNAAAPLPVQGGQLQQNARRLLHSFREDFGDWMQQGAVVMRPEVDASYETDVHETHDVTVKTAAYDSGAAHRTEAVIDVSKKGGDNERQAVAHLAISAVEPTIGAGRLGVPVEPMTYVDGMGIGLWSPHQTLRSVQRAFDHGNVAEIEFVETAQPPQPLTPVADEIVFSGL